MLTGYPPFQAKTQEEIYKRVRNQSYAWPKDSDCGNQIPSEARGLVSSCLILAEEQRPDPDDIVEHPFFNMYEGCIPKRLDPACCHSKPVWLKSSEPRGDRMLHGYSLDYDDKLLPYIQHVDEPSQRYHSSKAFFYALCGVGRKPDGSARRSTGKSCSKSAYAECLAEDERGLQPVIPLPEGIVYSYPDMQSDWSLPDPDVPTRRDNAGPEGSEISSTRTLSIRTNAASASRTQAALAAAQQRRMESQSHAANLRQQARPNRGPVKNAPGAHDIPGPRPSADMKGVEPEGAPVAPAPTRGLSERPIRTRRGVAPSDAAPLGDEDKKARPQIPKSTSESGMLTAGKTRSQSRKLEAGGQERDNRPPVMKERSSSAIPRERPEKARQPSLRPSSKMEMRETPSVPENDKENSKKEADEKRRLLLGSHTHGRSRSSSKTDSSGEKTRSFIGLHPLFHSEDPCEVLPGTSVKDVNTDLRHMLSSLTQDPPARRRGGLKKVPHTYVTKWVDYTHRHGIGYVLDDGSLGFVFHAENGQPASSVVLRDGEKHICRRVRSMKKRGEADGGYSESDQLVPRDGKPVEIYENCDEDSFERRGGIRRAFVPPSQFEVKSSEGGGSSTGIKPRENAGPECERADAQKLKRVKVMDQLGMYMVGTLGSPENEGSKGKAKTDGDAQYVKFYQRLGNVGVWGFGDGALQVCLNESPMRAVADSCS